MGHVPNKRKKERERRNLPPEPGPRYGMVPVPTIGGLLASRTPNWAWAYCARVSPYCGHRRAVALVPFAIRWGLDASSNLIRKNLVCARCGHLGAQIITPSPNGLGEHDPFPVASMAVRSGMCNLYAVTKGQAAIREITRAMRDTTGNLPSLPAIFPDRMAPIVRQGEDGVRELVMARWGFPPPNIPGSKPRNPYLTNVRNTDSRHWSPWLKKTGHRCLVPVTSFAEPDNNQGPKSIWTWFAQDESRPLFFFAGIWREWEGERGPAKAREAGKHLLFSFLTTDASHDVSPVHSDATPVCLMDEEARDRWMNAPWEEARDLQTPPAPGSLRVVATGSKEDAA